MSGTSAGANSYLSVDWAQLQEVDLGLLDSNDPGVRTNLVEQAREALVTDGFLFVTGTGVTTETLERNLAIAQYLTTGLSREEKEPYAADLNKGSYRGYKLRGIWNRDGGVPDNIEVRLATRRRWVPLTLTSTTIWKARPSSLVRSILQK